MREVIFNPVFNDRCTFLKTSVESKGQYSEMEVVLGSRGENPLHVHTAFQETFTAIDGELGLTIGSEDILLTPGETYIVQPGVVHRFFNPGDTPITYQIRFVPGHPGMENMLRILYGLARDGKTNKRGLPTSLSMIALLSDMGNTELPGLLSWLAPFLKTLALRARRKGLEQKLLSQYCGHPLLASNAS